MNSGVERERFYSRESRQSKKSVDMAAFSLIDAFKFRLNDLVQFREGSSGVFLDMMPIGRYIRNPSRTVRFCIGNNAYQVEYILSGKAQSLKIIKDTFGASEDPEDKEKGDLVRKKTDVVILKSRISVYQKPIWFPKVQWHYPVGSRVDDIHVPQVNNAIAMEKASEMLAGLSPQK